MTIVTTGDDLSAVPPAGLPIFLQQQEWGIVIDGLAALPWRVANPIISKIAQQIERNRNHAFGAMSQAATRSAERGPADA
jgi:hypothetical protein